MPRPATQYLTRREARAAMLAQAETDRITQLTNLAQSIERTDLAKHQMRVEEARYQATEALKAKEMEDEVSALKFLSSFNPAKAGSDVELEAIFAMHPGAARSSTVREIYSRKAAEVEQNKKFLDAYKTAAGGAMPPTFEDGTYDMPRAQLQLFKNKEIAEKLASGVIDEEKAKMWSQVGEYEFANTWTPTIAKIQGEAATRVKAQERLADERKRAAENLELGIKVKGALKQTPEDLMARSAAATDEEKARIKQMDDARALNDANLAETLAKKDALDSMTIATKPAKPEDLAAGLVGRAAELQKGLQLTKPTAP